MNHLASRVPSASRVRMPLLAGLAAATLAVSVLALPAASSAAVSASAPVVINEIYGGGGNAGAAFNRDFIELRNVSAAPVNINGWSVQYASTAGVNWQVTPLTNVTLPPGGTYLVGEATGANVALPSFLPDADGVIPMSGTAGKVALVDSVTALSGGLSMAALPQVVDYVGWGTASDFAGTGAAPVTNNGTSVARNAASVNTANNAADFTAGVPTPTPAGTIPDPDPDPDPETVTIAQIQSAPGYVDKAVTTTGVVTARYASGGFNGYVIQTAGTGGAIDLATHTASDAVFVYSPDGAAAVSIGETLEVTGVVSEFNGLTEITVAAADAKVVPAVGAAPAPATVAWPATEAERESLESMLLAPQGTYTVSNTYATNQYGEVGLAFGTTPLRQPTDAARPGSPEAAAVAADNVARAVVLDDGASTNYLSPANSSLTPPYVSLTEPIVVGASATFTEPVIVDWRNSTWKLNPTAPLVGDGAGLDGVQFADLRTAAPAAVGGDVSVASFNVLNYFTTLGTQTATCVSFPDRTGDGISVRQGCDQRGAWDAEDLARQQSKIVAAINALDADVVGLMEIENSAALGEAADEATASLVTALNTAAGATRWAFVPSSTELPDPAGQDVITNAIIYQPATVTPVGASRALGTQSADDQAFGNAREPIAQVFRPAAGGERFLFAVNHFKSKSSPGPWPGDADVLDGQGASNESRERQAAALRDWIATIQGDIDSVFLAGDFNSYGHEDPLQVLYDAGYVDAEQSLGIETSSYLFSGMVGSLDHILMSAGARERATGGDIWNINSGEAVALEYSRYNVHGSLFYAPDPYRSSDHDPVLVGVAAGVDERAQSTTSLVALPPVHINRLLRATLVAYVSDVPRVTGTVEFREGDTVVGSAAVTRGLASLRLPATLTRGIHQYTATFVPTDPESALSSTSRAVTVIVLR
ncbi:hypothetical protein ASD65_02005 [Microbacterium sp. Root61]|nr:ExeM/NucH family extracellular endonuclease [Microbacterium sp. Root61]KRA23325.1 hypothetical protein ASD65_02005 [Microbacterium sp. Root61]